MDYNATAEECNNQQLQWTTLGQMRDCERNIVNRPKVLQQWRAVMRRMHNTTCGTVDCLGAQCYNLQCCKSPRRSAMMVGVDTINVVL
jgi:RecB family endonuclease NucS